MKRIFLWICIFLFLVFCISAAGGQEPAPAEEASAAPDNPETSTEGGDAKKELSENDYIEMDIRTSTLAELAAWCRELGLSEGGTKEDLGSRLRSYYKLPPGSPSLADQRIITIESAKTTENFTLEVVNEEYARLKGDVIVSLKDGNAVHRIKAWEILYNRTRNVLTASGKVEYVKEEGDTVETFKGESITVNLDNWSSIFMDGVSERSKAGNSTAYRFAGTVISRNSEEVTVLTGADITNPSNDEAYWSLHASKLWLLPGNDWAILNAVLKVGNIPLLYLPFFYYPADEIVFHPVLGFRSREGTFLQTTTYILGRPKTEAVAENSITKIFGGTSENMEKKREGIFLRTTGEKRTDPNDTRLSLIFDAYVNLGAYLGTELALPRKGNFGEFNLSAGVGLTRNIYSIGSGNTPFRFFDGVSEWNRAMLFSLDIPLRYRLNATGSFQIPNGSFSWAIPYYSDPYVDRDFLQRSEVLDWLSMLREGASATTDQTYNDTYLNTYEWRLSGSYTPSVSSLSPYISSFSISSISSSLQFSNRDSQRYINDNGPISPPNPGKSFFFPDRFTLYSISASMAGTPYTSGSNSGTIQTRTGTSNSTAAPGDSILPDLPISPWETDKAPDSSIAGQSPAGGQQNQNSPPDSYTFSPPVLSQTFNLPAAGGPQLSFDYVLTPTSSSELQFRSRQENWKEQEDINWGEVTSILSRIRADSNAGVTVRQSGGAYTGAFRLYGTGSWQDYTYLNEDSEDFIYTSGTDAGKPNPSLIKAAKDRNYRETYFTSSWDLSTSVRPFFQNSVWSNTSLQYNLRGLLGKTTVDTTNENPQWDWVMGNWNKDDIQTNQVTANLAANIMDNSQNISIVAVLPPKDSSLTGNATFKAWITETNARASVQQPWDSDLRKFDPIYLTETLRFGTWGSFRQYLVIDPEDNGLTTLNSDLNLSGFTASFSAAYIQSYSFNPNYGTAAGEALWNQSKDASFNPRELRFGYTKTSSPLSFWNNRFTFSVSVDTNMSFDLQRYTNSKLAFSLGLNIGIMNFLDLSFSTRSENAVIYRYFQGLFDPPPTELYQGYETNFFKDLFNSFRFDSPELRRQSGFKLKSLNVSLIHHLGDWNAKLSVDMTPYLDTTSFPYSYKFSNEISFLIQWVPIGEIKTEIDSSLVDNKQVLTIK